MTNRPRIYCIVFLLTVFAESLQAQERPGSPIEARGDAAGVARQDTLPDDTLRTARARLDGSLLTNLPVDQALDLNRLMPGFMQTRSGEYIFRTPRSRISTYVDGVPVRSLVGDRAGLLPSLNALQSVSLLSGSMPASRQGAAVLEYSTRNGGQTWQADVRAHADALAPAAWTQHQTRFELTTGGPIPGVAGLRLAVAGHLAGSKYTRLPGSGPVYLANGVDTVITLARTPEDSIDVVVPNYELADFNRLPAGNEDRSDIAAALTFDRGPGGYGLRYYRASNQAIVRSLDQLYNPDAWRGRDDLAQLITLSVTHPVPWGASADVILAHQRYDATFGMLAPEWAGANAAPTLGINSGALGFLADAGDWPVTEAVISALRSGVLPIGDMTFTTPDDPIVSYRQGVSGVAQSLRLNPYGARFGFPISGVGASGEAALDWTSERHWYGRASLSKTVGAHRVEVGGEFDRARLEGLTLPLAAGIPAARLERPSWSAGFINAGTALHDVRVSAGLRVEHHASDVMLPRLPGFVTFVPDSLRGDALRLRAGDGPWEQRLESVVDCGGAETAPERTNPVTGAAVCLDNFVPVESRTAMSPRLGLEFANGGRISARASYGSYVQPMEVSAYTSVDLSTVTTSTPQPRETEPVRENVAELGVRVRTTRDSWIDLQLFHLDITNPVVVRYTQYTSPVTGASFAVPVTLNGESERTKGLELTVLQQLASWSGVLASFGISELDRTLPGGSHTTLSDPLRAAGVLWLDLGRAGAPSALEILLRDLKIYATASYSQGERYTRLRNTGEGHLAGRLSTTFGGAAAEELNASQLPSRKDLDLRITKGFRVAGIQARAVADIRNPFGFTNVHTVYAETGTTENSVYRDRLMEATLSTQSGLGTVRDMVIDDWSGENDVNRHLLHRAEQRFGNGDGVFTVSEMQTAFGAHTDLVAGPQWLSDDRRELRIGVELTF